jgi:hypothetical protein
MPYSSPPNNTGSSANLTISTLNIPSSISIIMKLKETYATPIKGGVIKIL